MDLLLLSDKPLKFRDIAGQQALAGRVWVRESACLKFCYV
jgi:hypothetical protein